MTAQYDVAAIGNAIVDVISRADDAFLGAQGLTKGAMMLIDEARAHDLYGRMAPGLEASGGSAANTVAGVASFGLNAVYVGKVAADPLGEIFAHDIKAIGVAFDTAPLTGGPATARCLVNVTPDGERTMCTFLGASVRLGADDVAAPVIEGARILYLEGYLFDPGGRAPGVREGGLHRPPGGPFHRLQPVRFLRRRTPPRRLAGFHRRRGRRPVRQ